MKERRRVFLAFLSMGVGITNLVLAAEGIDFYVPAWILCCVGIVLIAGAVTFFWTRSRFYEEKASNGRVATSKKL